LLCIQRTLVGGRGSGLASGLGAASADAFFGGVAAFGVTSVSKILVGEQAWVRVFGGAFLVYLGCRIFFSTPPELGVTRPGRNLARDYASTLALTLTNPMTIISFAAVFTGLGLAGGSGDYASAAVLVSGVFAGSVLWWVLLSSGVNSLRQKVHSKVLKWINMFSGAVIVVFGVATLVSLIV
jgi:threonine/homoserine/homoserine lactone efflux protein